MQVAEFLLFWPVILAFPLCSFWVFCGYEGSEHCKIWIFSDVWCPGCLGLAGNGCERRHVGDIPDCMWLTTRWPCDCWFRLPRECAAVSSCELWRYCTLPALIFLCLFPAGEDSQGAGDRRSVRLHRQIQHWTGSTFQWHLGQVSQGPE